MTGAADVKRLVILYVRVFGRRLSGEKRRALCTLLYTLTVPEKPWKLLYALHDVANVAVAEREWQLAAEAYRLALKVVEEGLEYEELRGLVEERGHKRCIEDICVNCKPLE